ncbi:hypothetical protein D3C76_1671120 [compost metagenome]
MKEMTKVTVKEEMRPGGSSVLRNHSQRPDDDPGKGSNEVSRLEVKQGKIAGKAGSRSFILNGPGGPLPSWHPIVL